MVGNRSNRRSLFMALAILAALVVGMLPLSACVEQTGSSPTATSKAAGTTASPAAGAPTQAAALTPKEVTIGFSGPLSGVAAEYGKDCLNGLDMAVNEINAEGGVVAGKYQVKFKLVPLDDQATPDLAVNNSRRLKSQNNAIAIFNPVFNEIAPTMKINEEPGQEFIMMAYTSTPATVEMGNKLVVMIPPTFMNAVKLYTQKAIANGWKKAAMVITLGAYGDDWRKAFKTEFEAAGGTITADKPANYYTETDFSAQLSAALATSPDFLLIGGPSDPTALVVEQARGLGYKGPIMLIDQAKMDVLVKNLKGFSLLENTVGVPVITEANTGGAPAWRKRYEDKYKVLSTWEAVHNYSAMWALALAMQKAGNADDPKAIRTAFPQVYPLVGAKWPSEYYGLSAEGAQLVMSGVQEIKNGKYTTPEYYVWWAKTQAEFDAVKKQSLQDQSLITWLKLN